VNRAKILGTGAAVPKKLLTNADLEKMVEQSALIEVTLDP